MHHIEYIGPRPRKAAPKPWAGGWLMVAMVVGIVGIVAWPHVTKALSGSTKSSKQQVEESVAWLSQGNKFGNQLAAAALKRTREKVTYDPAYYQIGYPMGDVVSSKGVCSDVVIRSYRALGVDLQMLVHEDMKKNFRIYPQIWGLRSPDTNIDHRRVPNLQRFFSRFGKEIPISESVLQADAFEYGDVVAWRLTDGATHVGIVVPGPGERRAEKWIVHNIGKGPQWENKLFDYKLIGHYRYSSLQ